MWSRRAVGKLCLLGVVAMISPVCGVCAPGVDTPMAFIVSDADQHFTDGGPSSPISLRAVSPNGSAPFIYDWLVVDPAGASANALLAYGDGSTTHESTTQFSTVAEHGLHELFSTVTDSTGIVRVGRKLLRVGPVSGLDTSATHLGVLTGGRMGGQVLVQLNPRFGTAPYEVRWTTMGPGGGVDNARLSAVSALASTFTSTDKTGTYIVTAEIVDSAGAAAVETVAVIVRGGPALDVSADRASVLSGGGADGIVGLLATPIGGSEPFTYEWEIIGPDGVRRNDLLWDTSVRDPIFESDSPGAGTLVSTRGAYVARCVASGAFGTVLIGSTTIDVTAGISLAIRADRLALPAEGAGGAQATLTATVRGAQAPQSIVWRVSGPEGEDATSLLTNSTGIETSFASDSSGAGAGSYVVRCSVSDARGRSTADALVIAVGEPLSVSVSADRTSPATRGNAGFDSAQLKVRASGGTAPYTYQWFVQDPEDGQSGGLLDSSASANPTFIADTRLGPHTAWCVVTDADGAVAADGVTLNVGQPLNVEVAIDKPARGGLSPRGGVGGQGRLFGRAQGGTPPYTYNWEVVDANGVTDRSVLSAASVADPIFTSGEEEGAYRATLTVTDALGAVFTDSIDVVVREPADGEAGGGLRVEVTTDRKRLQPLEGIATLQVEVIGSVTPMSFEWEVINDHGAAEGERLDVTTGAQVIFAAGALEGRYRVQCTATDSAGQVARGSVQLEVTEAFDIAVATSVTHLAPGGVVELSVEPGGGTPNFTYFWGVLAENGVPAGEFTTGATTDGEALQISADGVENQWTAPQSMGLQRRGGIYRILVTATDGNGLTASAAARVTVSDAFAVELSATETHLVPGDAVGLTATRVGGTAPVTYVWSSFNSEGAFSGTFTENSAGTGQAEQIGEDDVVNIWTAPLAGPGTTGRYEIQVTAIDADGDTFSDVVEVIVIEPLSMNLAAGNVVVAPSGSTMLIADRTGGEGPFAYAWTATDSNGQPAGAFITDSTDSGAAIQANQADDATNFWIAPIDTAGTTGLYDVTCTVVDSLGNVFADSIQIVVGLQDSLNADLSANKVFVPPGGVVHLAAESIGGVGEREFTWQVLNESGVSAGTLGESTQTSSTGAVTNSWTAPASGTGTLGTYRIEVTVSDAAGASFTDSVPIVVRSPVSLHISAADIMISPSTNVSLSATPTGGEPPFRYTWSSKDGTGSSAGTFTSGSSSTGVAEQSGQDAGVSNGWRSYTDNSYTITCTVEDNIGQAFTDSITIVVTTEDVFSFDVTADKAVVGPGETVTLAGNQTSGSSLFTYVWTMLNESGGAAGTPSTLTQSNVIDDTTTTWVAPTGPTAEGTYKIACTVTDAGGKSFTDSISVKVSTLAIQNLFFDPAAADTTSVLSATLLSTAGSADPGQQIVAGFTNPVHPRNIVINISDADVSITGGTARVTGLDSRGLSRSEVITITGSVGANTTHTGVVPFATVTQIDLFDFGGITAFGDSVSLGVGTKFGLTGKLNAASDVLYVNEAGTVLTSGYTVDATASQQGITFVSAPNGARDYVIVFRVR